MTLKVNSLTKHPHYFFCNLIIMINFQQFKLSKIGLIQNSIIFGALLFFPLVGFGQSVPTISDNPAAALKNIEENSTMPKLGNKKQPLQEAKTKDTRIYISHLLKVETSHELIKNDILAYWAPFEGKSVTNQQIADFKEWAWKKFNDAGYFAFLYTETSKATNGDILIIKISLPTVKDIKILSKDKALAEQYANQIIARVGDSALPGRVVDVLALEQKINSISFDLPIALDLNIRPVGSDQVTLVVNVSEKENDPGATRYSAVQVNNYGLRQYGSIQALGIASFSGFTPDAATTILGQASEGLSFGRIDYEAPVEILFGRVHLFNEAVFSRTIFSGTSSTRGQTTNHGLGLTNILDSNRAMVFKSTIDFSQRHTTSRLKITGTELSNIVDDQIKVKLSADNSSLAKDNIASYEGSVVTGNDDNHGHYSFILLGANFQKNLNEDGLNIYAKVRAQGMPSRNLDTYNRFSLGGVNGVRAYTTLDGVGDVGALASLELRQQYLANHYIGIFYDAGFVKKNRNPIQGQYNDPYSLQAAGMTFIGTMNGVNYNASVAKAVGRYSDYLPGLYESKPHSWRVNFALTYPI